MSAAGWLSAGHVGVTLREALVPVTALVLAVSAVVLPLAITDTMGRVAERMATDAVGADLQLLGQYDSAAIAGLASPRPSSRAGSSASARTR